VTSNDGQTAAPGSNAWFVTTRWSLVGSAREPEGPGSQEALEALCRAYWYPLYAYVRRLGHAPADAQDLTQGFFAQLLGKHWLDRADRERGRFRTFLLVALKRFLANEHDRAHTAKRGAGNPHLPLDTELAERQYGTEPAAGVPADRVYERRWALTLLDRTLGRLRREYTQAGRESEFDRLKIFLTADKGTLRYAAIAADLGSSEAATRVAVHRLRRRFREVFREETAHTVASAEDVDEEVRHLVAALAD
jgi:RNA polymerase sigma-70 factor (ECF subfamily)